MQLPDLKYNYNDASIEEVVFGPRREVNLKIQTIHWNGNTGQENDPIIIRFGGIMNFESVKAFFATSPYIRSELASLAYDKSQISNPNHMFVSLRFERIDAKITIECSSVSISDA